MSRRSYFAAACIQLGAVAYGMFVGSLAMAWFLQNPPPDDLSRGIPMFFLLTRLGGAVGGLLFFLIGRAIMFRLMWATRQELKPLWPKLTPTEKYVTISLWIIVFFGFVHRLGDEPFDFVFECQLLSFVPLIVVGNIIEYRARKRQTGAAQGDDSSSSDTHSFHLIWATRQELKPLWSKLTPAEKYVTISLWIIAFFGFVLSLRDAPIFVDSQCLLLSFMPLVVVGSVIRYRVKKRQTAAARGDGSSASDTHSEVEEG